MYERSKIQMEERERKLKNLQEKLMADYTFAPASSVSSLGSSRAGDGNMVFDRLYNADTAAIRAYRASPRGPSTMNPGFQSPPRRIKSNKDGYITPSRLETLHAKGQNKQRARCMTQKVRRSEYVWNAAHLPRACHVFLMHPFSCIPFLVGRRRGAPKAPRRGRIGQVHLYSENQVDPRQGAATSTTIRSRGAATHAKT